MTGALFRAIDRNGNVKTGALDGSSINQIIKSIARDAHLDTSNNPFSHAG